MACWSYISTYILGIVFEYILEDKIRKANYHRTAKDIGQCKNWAGKSQMNLYKNIAFYTFENIKLFISTLNKYNLESLAKKIAIFATENRLNYQCLPPLLQEIGFFVPRSQSAHSRRR